MIPLALNEIKTAVRGASNSLPDTCALSVSTDTRGDLQGALYIALRGKRFDGHDYIDEAYANGAVCVISECADDLSRKKPVINVKCAYKALLDLAQAYMRKINIPVVGITGSTGKTTVKDMAAAVLSTKYKTYKTEGNFNNEIGLPLSVLKLDAAHEAAVFELGMRAPGEIRELTRIINPNVFVITNIGYSHIERLGSRENIFKAKSEMLEFRKDGDTVILNGDDDMLISLRGQFPDTVYYGFGADNDITGDVSDAESLWGVGVSINYDGTRINAKIPIPGRHMAHNALAAAAVGRALGVPPASIKNGLENCRPSKNRMEILNAASGVTIINDAYNASPASVLAALDVLAAAPAADENRRVAVLGDMLELGDYAEEFHMNIGSAAAAKGIDLIICVGELAKYIAEGAGNRAVYFREKEELEECLPDYIHNGDTVLLKASRALEFETAVRGLAELSAH